MSITRERESRPGGYGTASQKSIARQAVPTIPPGTDNSTDDTRHLTGYAVLVEVPGAPEPRYRRRLFLSLHSAQRALERAEVRGLDARLVLLRLEPVGGGHDG